MCVICVLCVCVCVCVCMCHMSLSCVAVYLSWVDGWVWVWLCALCVVLYCVVLCCVVFPRQVPAPSLECDHTCPKYPTSLRCLTPCTTLLSFGAIGDRCRRSTGSTWRKFSLSWWVTLSVFASISLHPPCCCVTAFTLRSRICFCCDTRVAFLMLVNVHFTHVLRSHHSQLLDF